MKYSYTLATLATLGLASASPLKRQAESSIASVVSAATEAPSAAASSVSSYVASASMTDSAAQPTSTASGSSSDSSDNSTSSAPTDTQILQYALTLEHLESTFYQQALEKFSAQDFLDAGYPDWVRGRISQISQHEQSHVKLLSAALGDQAVAACEYKFPYDDVRSFLVFGCGLENIGVSAYIGASEFIQNGTYSQIATSITAVEARHQSFFYAPVLKQSPWTGPYDTPVGLNMVYTLAAQLITSCPDSNAMLPVSAYPPLLYNGSPIFNAEGGDSVKLSFDGMGDNQMAAIYNGLGATMVSVGSDGTVVLPEEIQGYSYIVITTASDVASVSSENVVAGPAEIQSSFDSMASNPGFMNPFGA